MLLTKETDYALRILRVLQDGEQHSAGELAKGELVPQQFAYKIIKKLAKGGLVTVARGAEGGCRLHADLTRVTLYDLMRTMGEKGTLSTCMEAEYACPWRAVHGGCGVHLALASIQNKLEQELRAHTLQSILNGEA